jgi:hypothetical protein
MASEVPETLLAAAHAKHLAALLKPARTKRQTVADWDVVQRRLNCGLWAASRGYSDFLTPTARQVDDLLDAQLEALLEILRRLRVTPEQNERLGLVSDAINEARRYLQGLD